MNPIEDAFRGTLSAVTKTREYVELLCILREIKTNPRHWSNNRRRLHGFGALRKSSNTGDRYHLSGAELHEVFRLADTLIETATPNLIFNALDQMVDVTEVTIGRHKEGK